jgi:hypothetical protein
MKRFLTILTGVALTFAMAGPALGGFTTIHAGSASEPDLWEALNDVAPGVSWTSTDYLNAGAGGRRVDDLYDQIWIDGTVTVTATALYWGGAANPGDTANQRMAWSDDEVGGSNPQFPNVNFANLGSADTFAPVDEFIVGDDKDSNGSVEAWSVQSLNSPISGTGSTDRMVTFDVAGLDIYYWDGSGFATLKTAGSDSYIIAFDPGTDGDYQDMLVLMEGARPVVPAPGAILLGSIGVGLVGWLRRRRAL